MGKEIKAINSFSFVNGKPVFTKEFFDMFVTEKQTADTKYELVTNYAEYHINCCSVCFMYFVQAYKSETVACWYYERGGRSIDITKGFFKAGTPYHKRLMRNRRKMYGKFVGL